MLAPRPWGLSLLKIRRHKHLLYYLIFIIIFCVLHYLDDFIGGVLHFGGPAFGRWCRLFVVTVTLCFSGLRRASSRIDLWSGGFLRAIATEMSLLFTGETLS